MDDELKHLPNIKKSTLDKLAKEGVTTIQEYFSKDAEQYLSEREYLEIDFLIIAELLKRSAEAIEGAIAVEEAERMYPLYETVGASSMKELSEMKPEAIVEKGLTKEDAQWLIEYAGRVLPIYKKAGVNSMPELAALESASLVEKGFSEDDAKGMIETARKLYPR
ncbi:MAG: hypothetical protein ACXADC_07005 [Candidatus Thorarchaeota archaeon]|jgi:hypothetical protein